MEGPYPTEEEVERCEFQNWYPSFRKCSLKSEMILLSEEFIEYLEDDKHGLFLPDPPNEKKFNHSNKFDIDSSDQDEEYLEFWGKVEEEEKKKTKEKENEKEEEEEFDRKH
ncbi:cell division cycle protein 123 [Anaeramoeba flamelloides]|uniref:Cell division cycle protein 123 n=1 Tax=Anaeramoeba flamelloides TaxID=1746091 RepID=A0AAV7ZR04_9EUKA|nr:cell division cycle protein 123 [Anaeramoeba flamelloides]